MAPHSRLVVFAVAAGCSCFVGAPGVAAFDQSYHVHSSGLGLSSPAFSMIQTKWGSSYLPLPCEKAPGGLQCHFEHVGTEANVGGVVEAKPEIPKECFMEGFGLVAADGKNSNVGVVVKEKVEDPPSCQKQCVLHGPDCAFVTYDTASRTCKLYTSAARFKIEEQSGISLSPRTCDNTCLHQGKRSDASRVSATHQGVKDALMCQGLCQLDADCGQFNFSHLENTCTLITSPAAGSLVSDEAYVHGYRHWCGEEKTND